MLPNKRKTHKLRKWVILYFLFLMFLGLLVVFYYFLNFLSHPLFVSPVIKGGSQSSDLEKKLKASKIPFSSIEFTSDSFYVITLNQGGKILVSSKKNINRQISSLQRILRELTIEGRVFKSIDFRFEKPVVEIE